MKSRILYMLLAASCIAANGDGKVANQSSTQGESLTEGEKHLNTIESNNYYQEILKEKTKELQEQQQIEEDSDKDLKGEALYLKNQKLTDNGDESWIYQNKEQLLKIIIVFLVIGFVVAISWRLFTLNQEIKKQNLQMENYSEQIEQIIEESDNLVKASWKDQKEGLKFVENPAYRRKIEKNLSKKEQLENEIRILQDEISQRNEEIDKLSNKQSKYLEEIASLKQEYNAQKKKVLDEGYALGFADTVLREFK